MGLRLSRISLSFGFLFGRNHARTTPMMISIRDRNAQSFNLQLRLKLCYIIPTNETELFDTFFKFRITSPASFSCCGPPENKATVVPKLNLNAL